MCKRRNLYVQWLNWLDRYKFYKFPIYELVDSSISAYANAKRDTMIGKIENSIGLHSI